MVGACATRTAVTVGRPAAGRGSIGRAAVEASLMVIAPAAVAGVWASASEGASQVTAATA